MCAHPTSVHSPFGHWPFCWLPFTAFRRQFGLAVCATWFWEKGTALRVVQAWEKQRPPNPNPHSAYISLLLPDIPYPLHLLRTQPWARLEKTGSWGRDPFNVLLRIHTGQTWRGCCCPSTSDGLSGAILLFLVCALDIIAIFEVFADWLIVWCKVTRKRNKTRQQNKMKTPQACHGRGQGLGLGLASLAEEAGSPLRSPVSKAPG